MALSPGLILRQMRVQLGFTIREVESASILLAEQKGNDEYILNISRLSDIETKGVVPSVFRFYSLSVIYRVDISQLLALYGIAKDDEGRDSLSLAQPKKTHSLREFAMPESVKIPVMLDPRFDPHKTTSINRMIVQWGMVPLVFLQRLTESAFSYGYIGTEDFTMYPLVQPGAFVQVDESKDKVEEGHWRSEYERPIYFVETREGFTCCWCALRSNQIVLQPHPLSPAVPRSMKYPQDAEILGQVVGLAMRLDVHPESSFRNKSLLS